MIPMEGKTARPLHQEPVMSRARKIGVAVWKREPRSLPQQGKHSNSQFQEQKERRLK